MIGMPKAFRVPPVARKGEAPLSQIAKNFITGGENNLARLCSQQRIWSAFSKKRGPARKALARKAGPPVHDDLVTRQFTELPARHCRVGDRSKGPAPGPNLSQTLTKIAMLCSMNVNTSTPA
jgi:hypothetical protein